MGTKVSKSHSFHCSLSNTLLEYLTVSVIPTRSSMSDKDQSEILHLPLLYLERLVLAINVFSN